MAKMIWPSGAKAMKYADIKQIMTDTGDDKTIGKISKNELKAGLTIDGVSLDPIPSGALPTPEANQIRTMEVVGPQAAVNGTPQTSTWTHSTLPGGQASLTTGQRGTFYFNGTAWTLRNIQTLPKGADGTNGRDGESLLPVWISKESGYAIRSQVEGSDGLTYVSLVDNNIQNPVGGSQWKQVGAGDTVAIDAALKFFIETAGGTKVNTNGSVVGLVNNAGQYIGSENAYRCLRSVLTNGASKVSYNGFQLYTVSNGYNTILGEREDGSFSVVFGTYPADTNFPNKEIVSQTFNVPGFYKLHFSWSVTQNAQGHQPDIYLLEEGELGDNSVQKYIDESVIPTSDALSYFVDNAVKVIENVTVDLNVGAASGIVNIKGEVVPNGGISNTKNIAVGERTFLEFEGRRITVDNENDLITYPNIVAKRANGTFYNAMPARQSGAGNPIESLQVLLEFGTESISINFNAGQIPPSLKLSSHTGSILPKDSVRTWTQNAIKNAVGTKIFNVQAYGAKGDGITDDRLAIQNAINACFLAGGGKVFFPTTDSFYFIGSQLASRNEVVNGNVAYYDMPLSQLVIPANEATNNLVMIEIVGEYKLNMADEAISDVGRNNKHFIRSARVTLIDDNSSVISTMRPPNFIWGNKNYIHVHIENINIRLEGRQGGIIVDNRMHGIDFEHMTQFTGNYVKVDTSVPAANTVEPKSSIGIIFPSVNNKVQVGEGSFYISGFNTGVMIGEHFTSNRLLLLCCVYGMSSPRTTSSFHSVSITHMNCESSRHMIRMLNNEQTINIFNYDCEHYEMDSSKWFGFKSDIIQEPGATKKGQVNIFNATVTKPGVGNVNEFIVEGNPNYRVMTGAGANLF